MVTAPHRVVVDPNVFVSAAISTGGATSAVIDLIDAGVIVPVVSSQLLAELHGVLRRDKFREWLDLDHAVEFVAELERRAETAFDPAEARRVSSDPDDDYLVALARSTHVDALVSGDADLTELDLDDLTVLTPRQLLEEVAAALDDPAPDDERF